MRIAAIDLGTNTLLMLIADVQRDASGRPTLNVICDEHRIVRLGQGLSDTGHINPDALQRACTVLHDYRMLCETHQVEARSLYCTSAVRRAANRNEVLQQLSIAFGSPAVCISGDEEARLTYLGSALDGSGAVIDIGGGSTEIVVGQAGRILRRQSIEIGAVRIHEQFLADQPCSTLELENAQRHIVARLANTTLAPVLAPVVAVAGTPTTLAAMDQGLTNFAPDRVHGYVLTREAIQRWCRMLCNATRQEILALPGVHPQRADILASGTVILERIVDHFDIKEVLVSVRGLRYGMALDYAAKAF